MGIKGLFPIIKDEAPAAIKEGDIKSQFGRKVAIVSTSQDKVSKCWHANLKMTGCVCVTSFSSNTGSRN